MLNKIFISKKGKDNYDPLYTKVSSSGYDKIDFERDRKFKLLQNLFFTRLDKDYVDKCSLLLYTCRKTKNYPFKRRHIKRTIYKYDENNDLYITLPKFKSVDKTNMKEKSKTIETLPKDKKNYFITDKVELTDKEEKYYDDLREKINDGIEKNNLNFNTISNNDEYDEEISAKEKRLYNILKTKYPSNNFNSVYNPLPKIIDNNRKEMILQRRIMDIDPILGNKINQNKVNTLTKNQQLNLFYLSELEIFNSLDKINSKKDILVKNKNKSFKKNKVLLNDLFNYDKNKWAKISQLRNYNENEAKIIEYNEKNNEKLNNFKKNLENLEAEKVKTENDVQETISHIENFLQQNAASSTTTPLPEREQTQKSIRSKNKK